jgi:glycosyltransferase involved in cell wall biosynthesis
MKKKMLFIVVSLELGGTENYLLRFLDFTKNKKTKAVVLCKRGVTGSLEKKYLALGVRVIKMRVNNFPSISWIRFYNFLKNEKIDTVCDFTGNFAGITLAISKLVGIRKRIVFYRKSTNLFYEDKFRLIYNNWLNKLTFYFSTKILSNSYDALHFFYSDKINEEKNKFRVIRNGLPLAKFNNKINFNQLRESINIPKEAFLIGHVGRFHPDKNHDTLVKVANNILKKHHNVYFLIIGRGVKKGISKNKVHERIILSNERSDIPDILQIMDAFYFPSISEGQPNALIEAMTSGLPFVASDIATVKESIPENYHKYLVPFNDIYKAEKKLTSFINKNSKSLFSQVQQFALSKYNSEDRFIEFYNELK